MVSLDGIVTKCSLVHPKVMKSVHYNEKKLAWHFREYKDQTMSANSSSTGGIYPRTDDDGNPVGYFLNAKSWKGTSLTWNSSSQNMATVFTEITKPYQYKKCQNERRRASSPEALT